MLSRKNLTLIAIGNIIVIPVVAKLFPNGGVEISFFIFILPGLFGIYVIGKKGYLTGISLLLLLFVGWWALIVLAFLGPITILLAAILPERKRCTHCQELINKDATRCPKCQGNLSLLSKPI